MRDSRTIANAFLVHAGNEDATLTPMQLLKLTYIAHGWMLGLYGNPLISDEIQAWQHGPVIPVLYNAIRGYRGKPVTKPIRNAPQVELNDKECSIIKQTYNIYGHLSGPALSRITHAPNTPWSLTYQPDQFGVIISDDIIQDHYAMLVE